MFKYFLTLSCFFAFFILQFSFCSAAILSLESSGSQYYSGDTFLVEIRLDTQGEVINAIEASLKFPQAVLEVEDFTTGGSILSLWLGKAEINQNEGSLFFSGGAPGGYLGKNGLIGRIIFKVSEGIKGDNYTQIDFIKETKVLLNDGRGTEAKLSLTRLGLNISSEEKEENQWQIELAEDNTPPEIFEIKINRNPTIFEGKYFIVFSAVDKQTGIDNYFVKEGRGDWQPANSPYVLKNQRLINTIQVKAVDKAGNERTIELKTLQKLVSTYIFYGVLVLILVGIIKRRIKKIKK